MKNKEYIDIVGAKAHNLKNISLSIPRNQFVVVTGLSGSGKSSLAFDTIYAEGQRRYMDTLSTYAKHFMGILEKPDVESITGLSPIIAIEQKTTGNNHNDNKNPGYGCQLIMPHDTMGKCQSLDESGKDCHHIGIDGNLIEQLDFPRPSPVNANQGKPEKV